VCPMAHVERQISVERVTGVAGPLYRLDIEGFNTFLVNAEPISRVLGIIFGTGAAAPFKALIDGPAGSVVAYRPLDAAQLAALDALLAGATG
jgi:hypothetical protein